MASTVSLGISKDNKDQDEEIYLPMQHIAPFIHPNDLVIGGWDINNSNMADAMESLFKNIFNVIDYVFSMRFFFKK